MLKYFWMYLTHPTYSEILYNSLASLAILIGGSWTFWKFVIQRDRFPRPEFNLDLNVIGEQKGRYLVELSAILTNKSSIRLKIPKFHFSLFYLSGDHHIEDGDEKIDNMVRFEPLIKKRLWLKHLNNHNEYTFVDADTTQKYSYVTWLPGDATFALLQSKFYYQEKASDFHSSQKCFRIEIKSKSAS